MVRLDRELTALLDQAAAAEERSRTAQARHLLRFALEQPRHPVDGTYQPSPAQFGQRQLRNMPESLVAPVIGVSPASAAGPGIDEEV